jgi:hypothetical protein
MVRLYLSVYVRGLQDGNGNVVVRGGTVVQFKINTAMIISDTDCGLSSMLR